jgi:Flp pilus assembly protein TadG
MIGEGGTVFGGSTTARASSAHAPTAKPHREAGQALLELALVAPIMILILAALVQFGLIFESQIGINNAAREAARRGATLATPDAGTATINANWTLAELQSALGNTQTHNAAQNRGLEVCFYTPATAPNDTDPSGNHQVFVKVTAGYAHPVFLPIVDLILDGIDGTTDRALLVETSTEFRVEQEGDNDIGVPPCAT